MAEPTLEQLRDAWLAHPPAPARAEDLAEMLVNRFNAYEIPVGIHPASDYALDDGVNEAEVWKLFTIDDPLILNEIVWESEPEWQEHIQATSLTDEWPMILGNWQRETGAEMDDVNEIGFRLITAQTGRNERISAVLEARDGLATGFKVCGASDVLIDVLIAHVGVGKHVTLKHGGFAVGDINDGDFARYLRLAHAEGILKLTDVTSRAGRSSGGSARG